MNYPNKMISNSFLVKKKYKYKLKKKKIKKKSN